MYKLVSPVSLLSPTRVYLVMSLINDGTSIPFIVVVDSLNVFGAVSVLARFTIVYFTLSITTSIGFLSSTFTFNIYVLTLPFVQLLLFQIYFLLHLLLLLLGLLLRLFYLQLKQLVLLLIHHLVLILSTLVCQKRILR